MKRTLRYPLGSVRTIYRTDGPARKVIRVALEGPGQWVSYARWIYERDIGPVPPGYYVTYKDRDTLNCTAANLVVVKRGQATGLAHHQPLKRYRRKVRREPRKTPNR